MAGLRVTGCQRMAWHGIADISTFVAWSQQQQQLWLSLHVRAHARTITLVSERLALIRQRIFLPSTVVAR